MDCKVRLAFFRLLYVLFVAAVAGTVYFLPDCFTDRYFTSGQLWVCGCAGLAGVVAALGGRLRCSRLGAVVGVALFAGWGYGFAAGYLGGQALACGVSLWLVLLVAEGSAGKVSYRDVYFVVALSLGVEAAVGLGQFAGWWHSGSSFRVTGTFDNPAGLAAYAAVCFPCALHFLRSPRWGARAYGGAVALLAVAAVVASGSRAGMAALAAAGVLWGWQAWGRQARRARWWLAGMAVAGILAGVWLYHWKKDSADGRLLVWRCTWEMMADAPVAGHAPGSFQAKYMGYQAAFLERHAGGRQGWLADNVKHPFNEYLKVGAECGIAGLAALAVVLWWLWRRWRRSRGERQPLFLGVAGVAVCGLFSYPLNYPGVVAVLFLRGTGAVFRMLPVFVVIDLSVILYLAVGFWEKRKGEKRLRNQSRPGDIAFFREKKEAPEEELRSYGKDAYGDDRGQMVDRKDLFRQPETIPEDEGFSSTRQLLEIKEGNRERRLSPLNKALEEIRLTGFPFVIGKDSRFSDHVIRDERVSRMHLEIDHAGDQYFLTDLNSTNGTTVAGRRLNANERALLSPGDEISLGGVGYVFM